jgi:hypothetical protein
MVRLNATTLAFSHNHGSHLNPGAANRSNMTLFTSDDSGHTWVENKQVDLDSAEGGAYSSLVTAENSAENSRLFLAYERGTSRDGHYANISFCDVGLLGPPQVLEQPLGREHGAHQPRSVAAHPQQPHRHGSAQHETYKPSAHRQLPREQESERRAIRRTVQRVRQEFVQRRHDQHLRSSVQNYRTQLLPTQLD